MTGKSIRVAILGANGQLGSDLVREFEARNHQVIALTHEQVSVESHESVHGVLAEIKPDVILNTTAFHVVPRCETEPLKAFEVNALGALNIAKVSEDLGAVNLFYSTDYVFDGLKKSPYIETDMPNPLNVYASTKLAGEHFTLNNSPKPIVIRVSGIYGRTPCRAKGGNFVTTMIRLAGEKPVVKVVEDEILTPTPTKEIAAKTADILQENAYGLFHLTSEGECSWYEFARVIFDTLSLATPLVPCSVADLPKTINRPTYSVLENKKAKDLGVADMPDWKHSLRTFLGENFM